MKSNVKINYEKGVIVYEQLRNNHSLFRNQLASNQGISVLIHRGFLNWLQFISYEEKFNQCPTTKENTVLSPFSENITQSAISIFTSMILAHQKKELAHV